MTGAIKSIIDEVRLFAAERLAFAAFRIAPPDHPESFAYAEGYRVTASRILGVRGCIPDEEFTIDPEGRSIWYDHGDGLIHVRKFAPKEEGAF